MRQRLSATGRYLQPDPLGYPDGPDAYLYAGGDPLNRIDPTGLYQEDVHYYMVFFLALAAGLDYENARITALASQYIDDNPMTRPLNEESLITMGWSAFKNHQQLQSYHFVLSDETGHTLASYDNSNVNSVVGNLSPQLNNLLNAVNIGNPAQPCARYQFLGEFLHAYADTFSHRNRVDTPFDAFNLVGMGMGHGAAGSQPDYTYNDGIDSYISWETREARSLAAERAMFDMLGKYANGPGVSMSVIEGTLREFNATKESGPATSAPNKIAILTQAIKTLMANGQITLKDKDGKVLAEVKLTDPTVWGYDEEKAKRNRELFLGGLKESDYKGTCLPGGARCKPF